MDQGEFGDIISVFIVKLQPRTDSTNILKVR